jgi:nitroimidazol reductase NimA-like FMN-containing flavoprotein (pyridoxamine 5'-phosphate oxidase superfamily)
MTRNGRTPTPAFAHLSERECIALLEAHSIGRVGWQAADGPQVLPVTYTFRDGVAYLRTSPQGILSELVRPTDVAFEVDELDPSTRTGWSVVVHGQSRGVAAPSEVTRLWEADDLVPWAPGGRSLFVQIRPSRIRGRIIRRTRSS